MTDDGTSVLCRLSSVIRARYEISESIGGFKQTRGTETSQYPEERTSTETPLVVASERGPRQWRTQNNRDPSGKPNLRGVQARTGNGDLRPWRRRDTCNPV